MRSPVCGKWGLLGLLTVMVVVLAAASAPVSANVYATDLKFSAPAVDATNSSATVDLSFRLNEPAAETGIDIYRADNNALVRHADLGSKPRGRVTWTWDLKDNSSQPVSKNTEYYFKVRAKSNGFSAWTQISNDNDQPGKFYHARSVDVNKDPASPFFGRIYVNQPIVGATTAPPEPQRNFSGKGLWAMNADMTDALGQGDNPMTGGVAWVTSSNTPYHITVGPEGKVYMFGWADAQSGVWVAPQDLSGNWVAILDPADATQGTGALYEDNNGVPSPPALHGSVSGGIVLGKGLNRKLYTLDEDIADPADLSNSTGSIWMYAIGALDARFVKLPVMFWNDSKPNITINAEMDVDVDAQGNFYMCQNRLYGTDNSSLWKIAPDGNPANDYAPLWRSIGAWGNPDPLKGNRSGVAVDNPHNRIVTVGGYGTTPVINAFSTSLDISTLQQVTTGGTYRDVAVDAVGNVYAADIGNEMVRVYSPPDGVNEYTTKCPFTFVPTSGDASKPATPVVTAPPTSSGGTQLSASWTATGVSYRYAISVTADDEGEYVKSWTNTTSTSVTATGLALEDGVKYFWFVQAKSANGVWSDIGVSAGTVVQAPSKIGVAKLKNLGIGVSIENVAVTRSSATEFWVQEQDRSAGVRVLSSANPAVNTLVTFAGTLTVDNSTTEKYIDATGNAVAAGAAFTPAPLKTGQKDIAGKLATGGNGLPDDGLLVTVWGKTTQVMPLGNPFFYMDDGSGVANDTTSPVVPGIKVTAIDPSYGVWPFSLGEYWSVTGIVRLQKAGSNVIPVVEVKGDENMSSF